MACVAGPPQSSSCIVTKGPRPQAQDHTVARVIKDLASEVLPQDIFGDSMTGLQAEEQPVKAVLRSSTELKLY